jgi:putative inorganic carbon (HCO3(-)) transporter
VAALLTLILGVLGLLEYRAGGFLPVAALGAGILAYAVLCAADLEAAFILILAVVPFSVEMHIPGTGSALQVPTEPMLFVALAAWLLRFLARKSSILKARGFTLALLLALAACLVSIIDCAYRFTAVKATMNAAWYAMFGIFLINNVRSRGRLLALVAAWLLTGTAIALYSLANVAAGHYYKWAGLWYAFPFFTEHGSFAAYLSFVFTLALALALEVRGVAKLILGAVALLVGSQVVLSLTRGAWFGLAGATVLMVVVSGRRLRRPANALLLLIGLCAATALFVGTGSTRVLEKTSKLITDTEYVSNLERLNRWYAGWNMFRSDPLTGVGFGAYSDSYLKFRRFPLETEQSEKRMGAHSEYLRVLAETGLVGFLAAGVVFLVLARTVWRVLRRARDPVLRGVAVGLTAGLVTYLIHAFVNNFMAYDKVAIPVWASVGILFALDAWGSTAESAGEPAGP